MQVVTSGTAASFGTTITSFSIVHMNPDNATKCKILKGCTVKGISISGTSQDYVKMSVSIDAK